MNKQDFFTSIHRKKCNVTVNSKVSRFRYIYMLLRDVQRLKKEGHDVSCKLNESGFIEINNGQFFMPPKKDVFCQPIEVKSTFLFVGDVRVDKRDVISFDNEKFVTKNFTYSLV